MARPDHRIERGQKISSALSASGWNRAQDAADIVLGITTTQVPGANYVFQRSLAVIMKISGGEEGELIPVGSVVDFDSVQGFEEINSTGEVSSGTSAKYAQGIPTAVLHSAEPQGGSWNQQTHCGWGVTAQAVENDGAVEVIVAGYAMVKVLVLEYDEAPTNLCWAVPASVHFNGQDAESLKGCLELTSCGCDGAAKVLFVGGGSGGSGGVLAAKIRWAGVII